MSSKDHRLKFDGLGPDNETRASWEICKGELIALATAKGCLHCMTTGLTLANNHWGSVPSKQIIEEFLRSERCEFEFGQGQTKLWLEKLQAPHHAGGQGLGDHESPDPGRSSNRRQSFIFKEHDELEHSVEANKMFNQLSNLSLDQFAHLVQTICETGTEANDRNQARFMDAMNKRIVPSSPPIRALLSIATKRNPDQVGTQLICELERKFSPCSPADLRRCKDDLENAVNSWNGDFQEFETNVRSRQETYKMALQKQEEPYKQNALRDNDIVHLIARVFYGGSVMQFVNLGQDLMKELEQGHTISLEDVWNRGNEVARKLPRHPSSVSKAESRSRHGAHAATIVEPQRSNERSNLDAGLFGSRPRHYSESARPPSPDADKAQFSPEQLRQLEQLMNRMSMPVQNNRTDASRMTPQRQFELKQQAASAQLRDQVTNSMQRGSSAQRTVIPPPSSPAAGRDCEYCSEASEARRSKAHTHNTSECRYARRFQARSQGDRQDGARSDRQGRPSQYSGSSLDRRYESRFNPHQKSVRFGDQQDGSRSNHRDFSDRPDNSRFDRRQDGSRSDRQDAQVAARATGSSQHSTRPTEPPQAGFAIVGLEHPSDSDSGHEQGAHALQEYSCESDDSSRDSEYGFLAGHTEFALALRVVTDSADDDWPVGSTESQASVPLIPHQPTRASAAEAPSSPTVSGAQISSTDQSLYRMFIAVTSETCSRTMSVDGNDTVETVVNAIRRIEAETNVDGNSDSHFNYTHQGHCSKPWNSLTVQELVDNDPSNAPFIFGLSNGTVVAHCTIMQFTSIQELHNKFSYESFEFHEQLMMLTRRNLAQVHIYRKLVQSREYSPVASKVVGMIQMAAELGDVTIDELECMATDDAICDMYVTECLEAIRLMQEITLPANVSSESTPSPLPFPESDLDPPSYSAWDYDSVSDRLRIEDHNIQANFNSESFSASALRLDQVPPEESPPDRNTCEVGMLDENSPFWNLSSRLKNEAGLRVLAPLLCHAKPPAEGLVHSSLNNAFVQIADSAKDVMSNLSMSDIKAISDFFVQELHVIEISDSGNCLYDAVGMGSQHCKNLDLRSSFNQYVTENPDGLVGGLKARDAIYNDTNGKFDLYKPDDRSRFAKYNTFHGPNDKNNVYGSTVDLQYMADETRQHIIVMGQVHDTTSEECSPFVVPKQLFISQRSSHDKVRPPIVLLHGLAHPDPQSRTCHFDQDVKLQFGSDQLMCNGLHFDLLVSEKVLLNDSSLPSSTRMVLTGWPEELGVLHTLRCTSESSEPQFFSSHRSDCVEDFRSTVCPRLLIPDFFSWPLSNYLLDQEINHATTDIPVAAMVNTVSDSSSNSSSGSDSDSSDNPQSTVVPSSTIPRQAYDPLIFGCNGLQRLDQSDEQPPAEPADQLPWVMFGGDSEAMTFSSHTPPQFAPAYHALARVSPVPEVDDSDLILACDQENDPAYAADDIHARQPGDFDIQPSATSPPSPGDGPLARMLVALLPAVFDDSDDNVNHDSHALGEDACDEHSDPSNSAFDNRKLSPQHMPVYGWSDINVEVLLDEVRAISNELCELHEDMTTESRTLDAMSKLSKALHEQDIINNDRIERALAREQSLEQQLQCKTQSVKRHVQARMLMILERHKLEDQLERSNQELGECRLLLDSITTASEIDTAENKRLVAENASLRAQCADLMAEVGRAKAATIKAQAHCAAQASLLHQMDERSQVPTTESSVQTVDSASQDSKWARDEFCVNSAIRARHTETPADVIPPLALRDDTPPCSACIRSVLSRRRTMNAHNHCANDCYFLHPSTRANTKGSSVVGSLRPARNGHTVGCATMFSLVRDHSFNRTEPGWKYVVHNGTQTTPASFTYLSEVLSGFSSQHNEILNVVNNFRTIRAVRAMMNTIFSSRPVERVKNHLRLSVFIVHMWNQGADYSGVERDVMRRAQPPFYNYVLQRKSFRRWTQLPHNVLVNQYDADVLMWQVFLAWQLSLSASQARKRSLHKRCLTVWASQSLRAPLNSSLYKQGASGGTSSLNYLLADSSFEGRDQLHLAELFPGSDNESIAVTNDTDPDDVSTIVTTDPSVYPPHFESGTSTVTFGARFGQQVHNVTESFINSAAPAYESLVERLSPHLEALSATTTSVFKSVSARVSKLQTRLQRGGEDRDSDSGLLASPTLTAKGSAHSADHLNY